MKGHFLLAYAIIVIVGFGCQNSQPKLFTKLSPQSSGVEFQNVMIESPEVNILTYEYAYNGGGVAAADFNNDGLCDLYFTGNMVSNRLYLNLGDLKFKDVTEQAGVAGRELWKTGVATADVNGDGWLDMYVCYSGPESGQSLSNQLFVNKGIQDGVLTFVERAVDFGLDAPGTYSTQAAFFDFDRDGDLDMFLVNHGNDFYSPFVNTNKLRNMRHPQFGNRLYRNDLIKDGVQNSEPNFVEVSQQAGIHGGGINFGLGVSISDVNNDGWPDIFVTNDYEEQDFLYLNNHDGTFRDATRTSFGHLSRNGMGTDIADYNNDGKPDLVEVDMWPEDNYRQKLLRGPDDYNRYQLMVDSGFYYQQMRNTLQLNTGITADGTPIFSEVGQMAKVSSTDWSWAPLLVDVDNDGFKDLFITNGYLHDFTSMDFLKFTVEDAKKKAQAEGKQLEVYDLVSKMPSTVTPDYIFRNNGGLTFTDCTKQWGLDEPNLSFGSAYADLDNDGDLELITNNTNQPSTIWKNNSDESEANNFLRIKLSGPSGNVFGVGAKVIVESDSLNQAFEQFHTRGYQSSVDPIIHVGLGKNQVTKKVLIIWPDGKESTMVNVKSNQEIELKYETATTAENIESASSSVLFNDISDKSGIDFMHRENPFVDFDREPLIPYQLSRTGPALAVADVDGDGGDDFFVGGAIGQSGQLYINNSDGHFVKAKSQPWLADKDMEDTGAIFFDADWDGDADLFVVSGGNEYPAGSEYLDDRLYVNDGKGEFKKALSGIVPDHINGSCVTAADYDKDGDIDLYVGGRSIPGNFPRTTPGAVLKNESDKMGSIKFSVATKETNLDLREPGMVTDALWTDFNGDSWSDLIVVGEWMAIRFFKNNNGKLEELKALDNTSGLWTRITASDYDSDGDQDYIVGNAGQNLPWNISPNTPLTLYATDVNRDGRLDPIICYTQAGKEFPVASRDELLQQISSLRSKFTSYDLYGRTTIADIMDVQMLAGAQKLSIVNTQSVIVENLGSEEFKIRPLPILAQVSCTNGILSSDYNQDGFQDLLLAGNFFPFRTQYGRSDAGMGLFLSGDGKGDFKPFGWENSGFLAQGDIRNMVSLKGKSGKTFVLVTRNNDRLSLFQTTGR
jgi:hypothetical protein